MSGTTAESIAALNARLDRLESVIARVERRSAHALAVADSVDGRLSDVQRLEDFVIMPMLLHLAGEGFRSELREMLAGLLVEVGQDQEQQDRRFALRLRYWRTVLDDRPVWLGPQPEGWIEADE